MDADRFDLLARSLSTLSRRGLSGALAGLGLGGGLSAIWGAPSTDAKRKNNKKKCKKSQKKCGKKCIPKSNCCNILDCGHAAGCVNGKCECLEGFRSCGNTCVLDEPGSCCNAAECVASGDEYDVCINNHCECSGFDCDGTCCKKGEVCKEDSGVCEQGPCPNVQPCEGGALFNCGQEGLCTRAVSGGPVCIDLSNLECMACISNSDCVEELGAGAVCVKPGGCMCENTVDSFCARTIPV